MLISWASQQPAFRFSPLSLFAASEPGFWFDPSDISTLFQDTAGTTPVTAAGQSVGLVLDKSKGLVLGSELVTNGGFDTDTAWTKGTGWTISGGVATHAAGVSSGITQGAATAGKSYKVTWTVSGWTAGTNWALVGGNAGPGRSGNGTFTSIVTAAAAQGIGVACSATFDGSIDNISVKELPGNHASQSTSLSRPTYQVDSNGRGYLSFDGSDDYLVTPTITPGTNKAQVFAGVRKLSDAARSILVELGNAPGVRTWRLEAPGGPALTHYLWNSSGSSPSSAVASGYAAPITNVLTGIGDIAADTAILRVNAAQAASSASDQETGNYFDFSTIYIGRRGGTSLPFNGRIYSLICRFGPNLTADQIAQTEAWVNARTGAY